MAPLACLLALFHLIEAARPSQQFDLSMASSSCKTTAVPTDRSGKLFLLEMKAFEDVSFYQDWLLHDSASCVGQKVGSGVLDPEVNRTDPVQSSKLWLTITQMRPQLEVAYLCPSGGAAECFAELRFPKRRASVMDWIAKTPVFSDRVMRGFQMLEPHEKLIFETFLFAGLKLLKASLDGRVRLPVLFLLVGWCVYLGFSVVQTGGVSTALGEQHYDEQLVLPSPVFIMFQCLKNCVLFILGCGLFMAQGCHFFEEYDDTSGIGYLLVLAFPLLFGTAALLRIFMSTARCQVYYKALKEQTLVKYKPIAWSPLLLWFWLGCFITVGFAARVSWQEGTSSKGIVNLAMFASPLYYTVSSLWNLDFA
eukprot:Skav206518  [mRNA]  locus=scaffold2251:296949:299031:- [translate_table: standard]